MSPLVQQFVGLLQVSSVRMLQIVIFNAVLECVFKRELRVFGWLVLEVLTLEEVLNCVDSKAIYMLCLEPIFENVLQIKLRVILNAQEHVCKKKKV